MKHLLVFLAILALAACTSPSIPKGYTGPTALLKDTVQMHGFSRSDFFMVSKVNGVRLETSEAVTRKKNYGNGMSMYPEAVTHTVAAGTLELEVTARTAHAAPILALLRKNFTVTGTVTIEALRGSTYAVKGVLNDKEQAVWVVDAKSGGIVSDIITAPK